MGVIPTVSPFLLPGVLPGIAPRLSGAQAISRRDLTARLVQELYAGRLDTALLALPFDDGKNLETRALFRDPFKVALPKGHPLAAGAAVDIERLQSEELQLLKEGHCLREHALAACHFADKRRFEAIEATSLLTLVQMVGNGLGITLLPELAIDRGILKGTAISLIQIAGSSRAGKSLSCGAAEPGGSASSSFSPRCSRNSLGSDRDHNRFSHLIRRRLLVWSIPAPCQFDNGNKRS
ncbi:MAG: LysR substrate-binding domain-containing protein [Stellaceae bacterium]